MRANGNPVSDLFLVDAWQDLGEWVMANVTAGTRLMVIGTLNKESYTSRGVREHMTIVKAKYIRLAGDTELDDSDGYEALKQDCWERDLLLSSVELIEEGIETGEDIPRVERDDEDPADDEAVVDEEVTADVAE